MTTPRHDLYVGCEVVCVRADYDPQQRVSIKSELVEGQIYKIRWLGMYNHYLDGEYLGVRVEGINRGTCLPRKMSSPAMTISHAATELSIFRIRDSTNMPKLRGKP